MNKKAFAITGLVFVFVTLIFAASNHVFFSYQSKQKAVEFAFVTDAIKSLERDFPSVIIGTSDSTSEITIEGMGCDISSKKLGSAILNSVAQLNSLIDGTGIEVEIISLENHGVTPSTCSIGSVNYCGGVGHVKMEYKIKTPFFQKSYVIDETTDLVCSGERT